MATLLSEYSRSYGLPDDYWSQPRQSPLPAGNSSSKMSITTQEPSFSRKRMSETHSFVKTNISSDGNNDRENCKQSLKDNPAMRYKAGYRRVQFAQPTVYQLDYGGWTSENNSPLLAAQQDLPAVRKPLQQRQQQNQHQQQQDQQHEQHRHERLQQQKTAPQECRQKHRNKDYQPGDHRQQLGRSPVKRGDDDSTTRASPANRKNVKMLLPRENDRSRPSTNRVDVQRMQNGFAQRMGLTKPAERRREQSDDEQEQRPQASGRHGDHGVTQQPKRERKQRKRKQHKTAPPPLTEYQRQFNKELPDRPTRPQPITPHSNPGAVLPSSAAQVTTASSDTEYTVVPSRYSTIIAPSSGDPRDHWTSEYSRHYNRQLPTNKQDEPRTYRIRNSDTPLAQGPVEFQPAQDDPSWYEQVLELREKALMYKRRAEDSYLSQVISWFQDKENNQRELVYGDRSPSSLSSSSAGAQEDITQPVPALRLGAVKSRSPSPCSDELSVEDIEDKEPLDDMPAVRYSTTKPPCTCDKSDRRARDGVPSVVRKILADNDVAITNKSVHKARHDGYYNSSFSTPMSKTSHAESDNEGCGVSSTHSRHHFDRTTPVKGSILTSELASTIASSPPAHRGYVPPIYPSDSMTQFRSSNPLPNPVVPRQPKPSRSGAYSRRLPVSTRITIKPCTVQTEQPQPIHRPTNERIVPRLNIQQSTPPLSSSPPPSRSQYSQPTQRLPSSQARQAHPPLLPRQQQVSHQTGHGSECTTCGASLRRLYVADTQSRLGSMQQNNLSTTSHRTSQYNPSQYMSAGTYRVAGQSRLVESDNVSVSSLSSCSVASQVLQRARDRRDRFWATQHTE